MDEKILLFLKTKYVREIFISILLFLPMLNSYFSQILKIFSLPTITPIIYIVMYSVSLVSYLISIIKKPVKTLIAITLSLLFSFYSLIINPELFSFFFNRGLADSNFTIFLFLCLPFLLLFDKDTDINYLLKTLRVFSIITIILFILTILLEMYFVKSRLINYMTINYLALPSIFVLFHCAIREKNKLIISLVVFGMIFIVIGGTRGALLTLIMFLILYFFLLQGNLIPVGKITFLFVFLTLFIFFIVGFEQIISLINTILLKLNFQSRIVRSLVTGEFLDSSGRNDLYSTLISNFNLQGCGLFGDWYLVGIYSHNWIVETIITFGVIFGSIIIFLILTAVIVKYYNTRKASNVTLMFFVVWLISLLLSKFLLSTSYILSSEFWFLLGTLSVRNNVISDEQLNCKRKLLLFY